MTLEQVKAAKPAKGWDLRAGANRSWTTGSVPRGSVQESAEEFYTNEIVISLYI